MVSCLQRGNHLLKQDILKHTISEEITAASKIFNMDLEDSRVYGTQHIDLYI